MSPVKNIIELCDITLMLREKIHNLDTNSDKKLFRIEIDIQEYSPLDWLLGQHNPLQFYWESRDGKFEVAWIGSTKKFFYPQSFDLKTLHNEIQDLITQDSSLFLRVYGGLAFSNRTSYGSLWNPFGQGSFVLPRLELIRNDDQYLCAINILNSSQDISLALEELSRVHFKPGSSDKIYPEIISRTDLPDKPTWKEQIEEALLAFQEKRIEKIVLARKSTFKFANKIPPLLLLKRLKQISAQCYYFYFQPQAHTAFLGASPEQLYKRDHQTMWTEALAGTRPRGKSAKTDQMWSDELLTCDKDIREHGFVIHGIREILSTISSKIEEDPQLNILKLTGGQHLLYRFKSLCHPNISDAEILMALSPTPAVAGYPTQNALSMIEEIENFDRGWYAGPIGWLGHNQAEFAVAIRSGLMCDNQLDLFSGAGIVKGSVPDAEWDEIEAKIGSFTKAFLI